MAIVWTVASWGQWAETEASGQAAELSRGATMTCVSILLPGLISVH